MRRAKRLLAGLLCAAVSHSSWASVSVYAAAAVGSASRGVAVGVSPAAAAGGGLSLTQSPLSMPSQSLALPASLPVVSREFSLSLGTPQTTPGIPAASVSERTAAQPAAVRFNSDAGVSQAVTGRTASSSKVKVIPDSRNAVANPNGVAGRLSVAQNGAAVQGRASALPAARARLGAIADAASKLITQTLLGASDDSLRRKADFLNADDGTGNTAAEPGAGDFKSTPGPVENAAGVEKQNAAKKARAKKSLKPSAAEKTAAPSDDSIEKAAVEFAAATGKASADAAARPNFLKRTAAYIKNGWATVLDMVRGDREIAWILKPYRTKIWLASGLLVVDALIGLGLSQLLGPLLDTAALAPKIGAAAVSAQLWMYTAIIVVGFLVYMAVEYAHTLLARLLAIWASRDYRIVMMRILLQKPLSFHGMENHSSAAMAKRIKDDASFLSGKNVDVRISLLHYGLYIVLGTALMLSVSWPITLMVLAVAPILGYVNGKFGALYNDISYEREDRKAELMARSQQALSQAAVVKTAGTAELEAKRYDESAEKVKDVDERFSIVGAKYHLFAHSLGQFFTVYLLYIIGGWALALSWGLSFGSVIQLTMFAAFVKTGFDGLSEYYMLYKQYAGGTEVVRAWMKDAVEATPIFAKPAELKGGLSFEGVRFGYVPEGEPVLKDLTFDVQPGQTVALVGGTGSGKSTVVNLLLRLWNPQAGRIVLDGKEIADYNRHELLAATAVVPQETRLFNNTVRVNMTYGTPSVSEEDLDRAIKMAKADFIFDEGRFPDGLDTQVAEGGARLSGGERQRIAIVRALLRKPKLLLLDEATASLDNSSEKVVEDALAGLSSGADGRRPTTLVIAHRLSTIRRADKIMFLEGGRVAESGTHEELMALKGRYYELTQSRSRSKEPKTSALAQLGFAGLFAAGAAALAWAAWMWPLISGALSLSAAAWMSAPFWGAALFTGAGILLLPAAAFALTGLRAAMAMKAALGEIEDRAPPTWSEALFTPLATPSKTSAAYEALPERYKDFIELHEKAHRERGVGEIRAALAQLRGVPALLFGELKAWGAATVSAVRMLGNFAFGDRFVRPFLKKYSKMIWLVIGAAALHNALWLLGAHYTGELLDTAQAAAESTLGEHSKPLIIASIVVGASFFFSLIIEYFQSLWAGLVDARLTRDLRDAIHRKVLGREMAFHMSQDSAEMATRLNDDVDSLAQKNFLNRYSVFLNLSLLVISGALMWWANPAVSLAVFAVIPLLGIINGVFGHLAEEIYEVYVKRRAELGRHAQETLEQVYTVKTFGTEEPETQSFKDRAEALVEVGVTDAKLGAKSHVFASSLSTFFTEHMIYILGAFALFALSGLTVGQIAQMTFYASFMRYSFDALSKEWMSYKTSQGGTEVVREWLEMDSNIKDAPDAKPLKGVQGRIRFEGVDFRYNETGEPILSGVDFELQPGQTAAFVGESGSGKSTILRLVSRLWDPTAGKVTIDGNDLKGATLASLSDSVAVVHQDTRLFDESLRYNMTYGAGVVSEAELKAAIKAARAEFVYEKKHFPEGLDTRAGEGGKRLSGGQRQRVAIVRALLKKAPILVLDEATSALDKRTERKVQEAFNDFRVNGRKPTTLVVAHNLTTVMGADKIFVLDRGKIVEVGTHDELLAKGGAYKKLWEASLRAKK